MNRSEKAALIAQIKAKADAASFVVVTDFKGMTVEELTRLRAKLYECGGEYLVVKNTLARIALTDGMHDSVKDMFKENCGIALATQDPVAVAKAVSEFAKTSKLFTVRHASLEGKVLSAAQVDALAQALRPWHTVFYTCHCTGQIPYQRLHRQLGDRMRYLATGEAAAVPLDKNNSDMLQ